ncbi:hypothetical protein E3N88_21298 [Mikania micrantha]|uniref:SWIM-type domain-containing protein n=1 Tax=Mikania micrantha TaxID=192012 RepID=A0A5N6NLW7_9ASTR|nr:hypothetical protein E3N88_21298 [Mikania micrantha]
MVNSVHNCLSVCTSQSGDFTKFLIKDLKAYGNGYLEVLYGQDEDEITVMCSCKRFECYGLLCRHCFYVLRLCDVKVFPEKYITRRWTKDVVPNMSKNSIVNPHILSGINPEVDNMVRDTMTSSEYIVNKLVTDMSKLSIFRDTLKNLMEQTDVETRDQPSVKQKDIVSSFVPHNEESTSAVCVPSGRRNKGSGSHKRFKSKREQAISRMGKRSRGCHSCGQDGHDRGICLALRGPQKTG